MPTAACPRATSISTRARCTWRSSCPMARASGSSSHSASTASRPPTRPMPSQTRPTCWCTRASPPTPSGATKMDRPEWAAVNSRNGEVYFTLTNNAAAQRPITAVDARQSALLQRQEDHGPGSEGQSEWPRDPLGGGRRLCRRAVLRLGRVPVRRACDRVARQREPVRSDGCQRLLEPGRRLVQLCEPGTAVAADR